MRAMAVVLGLGAVLGACSHGSELDALRDRLSSDAGPDADAEPDAEPEEPDPPPTCRVVAPPKGLLNASDDEDAKVKGLQVRVRVETDADADVRLLLNDEVVDRVAPEREDDHYVASFVRTLAQGAHTVSAECGAKEVRVGSDEVRWEVDVEGCVPRFTSPDEGTRFTDLDDRDDDEAGLQVRVAGELTGDGCASVVAHACDDPPPDPAGRARETFTRTATLSGAGTVALCLTAVDESGNVETREREVERVQCAKAEVLCASDRACHADTDEDPEFCGSACEVCEAPGHGTPVCTGGRCAVACDDGYEWTGAACVFRPSCKGLELSCDGASCCAFDALAEDGDEPLRVQRGYDQSGKSSGVIGWVPENDALAVTVDDFELDRFEVTVGRFRRFLDDYEGWLGGAAKINPRGGQGHHPAVPASGWQAAWSERYVPDAAVGATVRVVPVDRADFERRLGACTPATWTDEPGDGEDLPLNCVSFYEAFLFCLYEGGRLPTEAEWVVASAGGRQQRALPWSDPPSRDAASSEQAVYGGAEIEGPEPVGRDAGAGRWGTHDLGGNLFEWTRDTWLGEGIYAAGSSNPVDLGGDGAVGALRVTHGGSYKFSADYMRTVYRQPLASNARVNDVGFRCAYPAENDN